MYIRHKIKYKRFRIGVDKLIKVQKVVIFGVYLYMLQKKKKKFCETSIGTGTGEKSMGICLVIL